MKFSNGYWLLREYVQAAYAAVAYDVEKDSDESGRSAIIVYAPTKRVSHRGDTLNSTLLKIQYSSPMPNVIRVRVSHFEGVQARGPRYELLVPPQAEGAGGMNRNTPQGENPEVDLSSTYVPKVSIQGTTPADRLIAPGAPGSLSSGVSPDQSPGKTHTPAAHGSFASLRAGDLSILVDLQGDNWKITALAKGELLTAWDSKSTGYMIVDRQDPYMVDALRLAPGECIYGLGERFGPFIKNGQSIDIWNEDGGTASEQAYKNIPFCLSNRGYGLFVNSPDRVSFEIASEKASRLQFSVPGEILEYYIIYGSTPRKILSRYTLLTGRPALLPPWAFGLWLTTSFTTSYDEQTVQSFIDGMSNRGIPLRVFHFDCFWMREYNWVDLTWDSRTFPDPEGMLARLKQQGLSICVWINPYVAQRSRLFVEAMQEGYLLKKPNGDVWQTDMWQAGMGIIDFTNPRAARWFQEKLEALVDMGVDSFKTDFGERIPTDVVYFDGSDPVKMHNYYSFLYNKTVFQVLEKKKGQGQAVLFARSATAGSQRFPAHWGGDCESTYEAMAETLRGGLSLALSGFGFWSHDIGGFEGMPPAELYKRWLAFGLLSPLSRLHGSSSYRVPWLFDEEAVTVARQFTRLKYRLMPYLYQKAVEAHQEGIPMLRPMLLEFPQDPTCSYLDLQYMLGDALLVAPVFSATGTVRYYVPAGRWTNRFSGAVVEGPRWVESICSALEIPLLVRPHTVLPIGAVEDRPDYPYAEGVEFELYEIENNQPITVVVPDMQGKTAATLTVRREGNSYQVKGEGTLSQWSLLFVGLHGEARIQNGSGNIEQTDRGLRISTPSREFQLQLL